jgi:uncharacterized membrane protein YfcA
LAAGFTAKVANVTSTVAVFPGTVGTSWAYREELGQQRRVMLALMPTAIIGAVLGAALLLYTPASTFRAVTPFLILGACAMLAGQDRLIKLVYGDKEQSAREPNMLLLQVTMLGVSIYGGYFGAGMGIIMLALFGLFLPDDIQQSNALKGFMAMMINGLAAAYFVLFGDVAWTAAAVMAVSALTGGYSGVFVARRLRRDRLRMAAVTFGVIAALVLMVR